MSRSANILQRLGVLLVADAVAFVAIMLYFAFGGMFESREHLYLPILIIFFIPLVAGFVLAIYHLQFVQQNDATKAKWWPRFLWSGPFAAGWYLSRLDGEFQPFGKTCREIRVIVNRNRRHPTRIPTTAAIA